MISCSHWGIFGVEAASFLRLPQYNNVPYREVDYSLHSGTCRLPRSWEIEPGQDVEAEMARPEGMIRLVRRPFFTRLRNHYLAYLGVGLSRWEALRGAWELARL